MAKTEGKRTNASRKRLLEVSRRIGKEENSGRK